MHLMLAEGSRCLAHKPHEYIWVTAKMTVFGAMECTLLTRTCIHARIYPSGSQATSEAALRKAETTLFQRGSQQWDTRPHTLAHSNALDQSLERIFSIEFVFQPLLSKNQWSTNGTSERRGLYQLLHFLNFNLTSKFTWIYFVFNMPCTFQVTL